MNAAEGSYASLERQLVRSATETVQGILIDSKKRSISSNPGELSQGVYYPNEYYKILTQRNTQKVVDYLVNQGTFFHGNVPNKYFNRVANPKRPTGVEPNLFVKKEGVKPSVALKAVLEGLSLIGCGEVVQVAYLEAIKDALGVEKFDMLFGTSFWIRMNDSRHPLRQLIQHVSYNEVKKGTLIAFNNVNTYTLKHINGEAQAVWTICVEDNPVKKFAALGLSPTGISMEAVAEELRREFNETPIGTAIVTKEVGQRIMDAMSPEHLAALKHLETKSMSPEEFKKANGGVPAVCLTFNVQRIRQLQTADLSQAMKLWQKWNPE